MSKITNITRGCSLDIDPHSGEKVVSSIDGGQKLTVHDWLGEIPNPLSENTLIEVQFKNTRKEFFDNSRKLDIKKGDMVVVEGQIGHDLGLVTMTSELVHRQMKRVCCKLRKGEFRSVLRRPNAMDISRWQEAIALEHQTMIRSRQISAKMGLDMKIGDVEYQADRAKAIFYYIADGRVDFRELIKVFAEEFRVRIEMKQIGARQEAGRIGGLGACGRELCCATWSNNFSSVSINAARVQDISPNPQKLAGQCGKLKCCLNYEMDTYVDARASMPRVNQPLETLDANYYLVKSDPLRGLMYFSSDPKNPALQIPLTTDKVRIIMSINRKGEKVANLQKYSAVVETPAYVEPSIEDVVGQDSLTRFDKQKRSNTKNRSRSAKGKGQNNNPKEQNKNAGEGENQNAQQNGEKPQGGQGRGRGGQGRGQRQGNSERNNPERKAQNKQNAPSEPRAEGAQKAPKPPKTAKPQNEPKTQAAPKGEKNERGEGAGRSGNSRRRAPRQKPDGNSGQNGGNQTGGAPSQS